MYTGTPGSQPPRVFRWLAVVAQASGSELTMSAMPSPSKSTPSCSKLSGTNCVRPKAPAQEPCQFSARTLRSRTSRTAA